MAGRDLICVAEILSAHGLKGEVKLKSFTEQPEAALGYGALVDEKQEKTFALTLQSGQGSFLIASIKGVKDRGEAEKLRGTKLFMPRGKLPKLKKNSFYFADLKGLRVMNEAGEDFGRVADVMNFGAGDIIAVVDKEAREYLLPFNAPYIGAPDLEKGCIAIAIPPEFPFSQAKVRKARPRKEKGKEKKQ